MSRRRYIAWNGTTGSLLTSTDLPTTNNVPTLATATQTCLQLLPTSNISVIEWGYQLSVVPTAAVYTELLTTGTVAASVTTFVASDIPAYDDPSAPAAPLTLSGSASGYTSTADGAWPSTSVRLLDQGPAWSQFYAKQFPLDREPGVIATNVLRVRAYSATAINIRAYIVFEA